MAKQKTKKDLIEEVVKLTQQAENLDRYIDSIKEENRTKSEEIRKEFAKAFGWYEREYTFGARNTQVRDPSWCEIFVELGKILNIKGTKDLEDHICRVENKVEDLINNTKRINLGEATGQIVGVLCENATNQCVIAKDATTGYLRKALPTDRPID